MTNRTPPQCTQFDDSTRTRPVQHETEILHAIRLALGREPDFRLWRNETGGAVALKRSELLKLTGHLKSGQVGRAVALVAQWLRRSMVRYGLCVGSADLIGILAPTGRLVALEVKSQRGTLSREQIQFLALVRCFGGFAAAVHSVEEARAALDRARKGQVE